MKKIIMIGVLLSATLFASDNTVEISEKDYNTTSEMLKDMKKELPVLHKVVVDYFKANKCNSDVSDAVSIKEIRDFSTTAQYGKLVYLAYKSYNREKEAETEYSTILNSYKFMNCGTEDTK